MARDSVDLGPADLPEHLTYCADDGPGITRKGAAPKWSYRGPDDKPVKDDATLDRIGKLVIPPAWTDVWIAPKASCHIQATGRDVRGRKQYRYHVDWSAARGEGKFDRMLAFGRALPRLRKQVEIDMARRGLPREKVVAAVVRMLEITLIRVGNDEYAKTNKSFGLTTMQKRHVKLSGAGAVFSFRARAANSTRPASPTVGWRGSCAPAPNCAGHGCSNMWTKTASATGSPRATSTTTYARPWATTSPPRTSAPGSARSARRGRCACNRRRTVRPPRSRR